MPSNPEQQKLDWLRLIRSETVGPITFWQLLKQFGSAEAALKGLSDMSRRSGKSIALCSEGDAAGEINLHKKQGFKLVAAYEPEFPQLLKETPDCPPVLSVYGVTSNLNHPTLGIVGARNASLLGRKFAEQLARDLSDAQWSIASGMARGIDRHAHMGALAGSLGFSTIAAVAGGIDIVYPLEHKDLYHQIATTGAVISEMPFGQFPGAAHFPRRNRLISGISRGVIIVEAAFKSGSLITARYTLEQNRELFAVPGSPLDPRCRGTNDLIRRGAFLVESAEDVLNAIGPAEGHKVCQEPLPVGFEYLTPDEQQRDFSPTEIRDRILQDLSYTPLSIDLLMEQGDYQPQEIMTVLLDLELDGKIHRHADNRVSLAMEEPHNTLHLDSVSKSPSLSDARVNHA